MLGVNPVPLTVTVTPDGPCVGLNEIAGVVMGERLWLRYRTLRHSPSRLTL